MQRYARCAAAVLCVALCLGYGSAAASSTSRSAKRTTPVERCAGGHSVTAKLGAQDFQLIQRFVLCLGRQWAVREGGIDGLGGLPGVVRVLNSFAGDPKPDASARFVVLSLDRAEYSDHGRTHPLGGLCFSYAYGDTAPPSPSLATIAGWIDHAHSILVKAIGAQGNFLPSTALVEHGAWFHDGSPENVRLAVVFAGGSVTGHADCTR